MAATDRYQVALLTGTTQVANDTDDNVLLCDATSAAFTVTLPDAGQFAGKRLNVKRINTTASGNNVTIAGFTPPALPTPTPLSATITAISLGASPTFTTSAPHNLVPGQWVTIAGAGSVTAANGTFQIATVPAPAVGTGGGAPAPYAGATTFTAPSTVTTSGGPYTSGGTVVPAQQNIDTATTLALAVGQSAVDVISDGVNFFVTAMVPGAKAAL